MRTFTNCALRTYNEKLPSFLLFNLTNGYLGYTNEKYSTNAFFDEKIEILFFREERYLLIDPLNYKSLTSYHSKPFFHTISNFLNNLFGIYSFIHQSAIYDNSYFLKKSENYSVNNTILNVGCGNCFHLNFFKNSKLNISHCDLIDFTSYSNSFFQLDITSRPTFEKYNLVWCFFLLEHLFDPLKSIENLIKSTQQNGEIWITIPVLKKTLPKQPKSLNLPIIHYHLFQTTDQSLGTPVNLLFEYFRNRKLLFEYEYFQIKSEDQLFIKLYT
jgi:hypothetical protein